MRDIEYAFFCIVSICLFLYSTILKKYVPMLLIFNIFEKILKRYPVKGLPCFTTYETKNKGDVKFYMVVK